MACFRSAWATVLVAFLTVVTIPKSKNVWRPFFGTPRIEFRAVPTLDWSSTAEPYVHPTSQNDLKGRCLLNTYASVALLVVCPFPRQPFHACGHLRCLHWSLPSSSRLRTLPSQGLPAGILSLLPSVWPCVCKSEGNQPVLSKVFISEYSVDY